MWKVSRIEIKGQKFFKHWTELFMQIQLNGKTETVRCQKHCLQFRVWKHVSFLTPYLPANSVVMHLHPCMYVTRRAPGIQPVPGKADTKAEVMAAASPLPGLLQRCDFLWFEECAGMGGVQVRGKVAVVCFKLRCVPQAIPLQGLQLQLS